MKGVLQQKLLAYYRQEELVIGEDLEDTIFYKNPQYADGFIPKGQTNVTSLIQTFYMYWQFSLGDAAHGIPDGACALSALPFVFALCFDITGSDFDIAGLLHADAMLDMHLKNNGAKHPKLKEFFFPTANENADGDLVERFTSPAWVAHIFTSGINKHFKAVRFAKEKGNKPPAPFFASQKQKAELAAAKTKALVAARAASLALIADVRKKHRRDKHDAKDRKRKERAQVMPQPVLTV